MLCAVCLTADEVRLMDQAIGLYFCGRCRHAFTPRPKHQQEVYEESYYLEKHPNWFANPNYPFFEYLRKKIEHYLPKGKRARLMDAGHGTGDLLKYLDQKNANLDLTGIDSLKMEHPRIHFIQGDFFQDTAKEPYDVVTSLMVVEHVNDPRSFAKKMYEYLVPGGLLMISTNNNDSLIYVIGRLLKPLGVRVVFDRVYSDHHLQHFTNASLRRLLENHGFEILELRNHNYPLKAVDTPPAGPIVTKMYLAAVWVLFRVSEILGNGFFQTYVCRKKA